VPGFYVNLPLRYLAEEPEYLDLCAERGLWPELGLDALALDHLDQAFLRGVARRLRQAGLRCSVHLPFLDLRPGSVDPLLAQATRQRLLGALEAARILGPDLMIAHAGYSALTYELFFDAWLDTSAATWTLLHESWPQHPPIYLENTFETGPGPLARLLDLLCGRVPGFGACLDLGHWHSFAGGSAKRDLGPWLDGLAERLGHLHLHDNSGDGDEHLGLGRGCIPWEEAFAALAARGLTPGFTLEPHTREDLDASLAFMAQRPEWFAPHLAGPRG
jgi:sugar phosphate isomerase/epimerase